MGAAVKIDLTYEQVLEIVRQLPTEQKIRLTKDLESEAIESKLSKLLTVFKTDELNDTLIEEEVEVVRKELYTK